MWKSIKEHKSSVKWIKKLKWTQQKIRRAIKLFKNSSRMVNRQVKNDRDHENGSWP